MLNMRAFYPTGITMQREQILRLRYTADRERERCLIAFLSLSLHPLSSTKLIFTLIASDYALLYKKAPYQTSSRKMEFVSGKVPQAITCSHFIMKIRQRKNSVKHFKTAKCDGYRAAKPFFISNKVLQDVY